MRIFYHFLFIFCSFIQVAHSSSQTSFINIQNICVEQNCDWHELALELSMTSTQPPFFDLSQIREKIVQFVESYPTKSDYWEILNKNLACFLIADHPQITYLSSKLTVFGKKRKPHQRWSTVNYDSKKGFKEFFSFKLAFKNPDPYFSEKDYLILTYEYLPDIAPRNYPDFLEIKAELSELLTEVPLRPHPHVSLKEILEKLLYKCPTIHAFELQLRHQLLKNGKREDFCGWSSTVKKSLSME
ncbi:hypothetical protein PHSC3_000543 [Chlamydiales bacterium STE3]|nr:hypothetical protein PHSC3_000543 [Chlamydiales bacterium STE3]